MLARKALAGTAGAPKLYVEDVMSTYLYTGNGSTQTITNNIDLSTEGGLVWTKNRDTAGTNHILCDTGRGITNYINSNNTNGQNANGSLTDVLTATTSTGYSLGADATLSAVNVNAKTYVSWTFRKAKKFFDVVTYTGNGTTQAISHNLGSAPGSVWVKSTSAGGTNWFVWHRSLTSGYYIYLNTTGAQTNANNTITFGNNTTTVDPTSTNFTIGSNGNINDSGQSYVAYLFAHDAGGFGDAGSDNVISCGSYTGNGSTTGPTVTLGYEPQWLLIKRASGGTGNWVLIDSMRGLVNSTTATPSDAYLVPNTTAAEQTWGDFTGTSNAAIPLATGFQIVTSTATLNNNTDTYIYIAIRRGPMKTPTSVTSVFDVQTYSGNSTANRFITTGFPIDANLTSARNSSNYAYPCLGARLTDGMHETYYAATGYDPLTDWIDYDYNNGYELPTAYQYSNNTSAGSYVSASFRRSPGFMDVVCYTGTGSARTVSHNLGTTPELILVKIRAATQDWAVYNSSVGNTKALFLNSSSGATTSSTYWNDTTPTSSVFTVGTSNLTNQNTYTYIAYLFGSVSGVSKVGSYTGNGTNQTINCGFTNGARFVLIRRTDSSGDWYFWDSARGIVAGDDPHISLNTQSAEVTNDDSVDTNSTGFVVNQLSATNINVNSATYLYLAIA